MYASHTWIPNHKYHIHGTKTFEGKILARVYDMRYFSFGIRHTVLAYLERGGHECRVGGAQEARGIRDQEAAA